MSKTVGQEAAAEKAAAAAAATERQKSILVIDQERSALAALADAAKRAAMWTEFGGRNDMAQHLSDLSQEHNWLTLINRDKWLGFTNPQAAYSWRQLELQQAYLMNRAKFGATSAGTGYTTPDQYLSYLQREYVAERDLNQVMLARAAVYKSNADAFLAYANALRGHVGTIGTLSEGNLAAAQSYEAALAGLPPEVTTKLVVDDSAFIARLASDRALLTDFSKTYTARDVITAAYELGGQPLNQPTPQAEVIPVSYGGPYQQQYAQILAEFAELSRLRAEIPVDFHIDPSEIAALKVKLGQLNVADVVTEHLVSAGGGIGGGGGPPPPPAGPAGAAPDPGDAEKWNQLTAAETAAGDAADADAVKFAALQAAAAGDADAAAKLAFVYNSLKGAEKDAADNAVSTTQALGQLAAGLVGATAGWGGLLTKIALFGGLTTVSVLHILIDLVLEFAIALGGAIIGVAALAAAVGIFIGVANLAQDTLGRISDRLKAVYTASTATGQAIYPMTNSFDKLASVIRPEVWQLYGDALTLVGGKMGLLGQIAISTGRYIDQLVAKFVVWFSQPSVQAGFRHLIDAGVNFAKQFGQIFLNLGKIIYSFFQAAQLTHIAEDIGAVIIALTHLVAVIAQLVPAPILAIVLGLHGLYLWGGLAVTAVTALLDPLRALAVAVGALDVAETALSRLPADASAMDKLKATLSDIGAGFAALPGRISGTETAVKQVAAATGQSVPSLLALQASAEKSGTSIEDLAKSTTTGAAMVEKWGSNLSGAAADALNLAVAAGATESQLAKISADAAEAGTSVGGIGIAGKLATGGLLGLIAAAGTFITLSLTAKDNAQQWIDTMNTGLGQGSILTVVGRTMGNLAAVTQQLASSQNIGAQATHELTGAQTDLSTKLQAELVHVGDIQHAYGVNMPQALGLLNTAGVKTSDLFTNQGKVWAAAEQQVAGLVKGYAAMGQGLTQLQGDVSVQLVTGSDQLKQMQQLSQAWDQWLTIVTGGQSAFVSFQQNLATTNTNAAATGASMGGLNAASLTLRSSYTQLIPAAGQVLDNIRQQSAVLQNGAQGSALLTRATRDLAAEMLPLAAGNKAAQASLLALVQEADPSINTWQKLTKWIGKEGVTQAAADLNQVMTKLEVPVSNLAADAAKLTTTLQQDLDPAMANAEFNALGGQKAFNLFATDLAKFGPDSQITINAGQQVAAMLISIDKNSGTAKAQFVAWAESMGLSQQAANRLWAEVSKGITPVNAMRQGLADTAVASDNLAKSGFFAQRGDTYRQNFEAIANIFAKDLPNAVKSFASFMSASWSDSYQQFERNIGSPVAKFFGTTLPAFFTAIPHDVAAGWSQSYQQFMTSFGSPVAKFFGVTFPGFFTGSWTSFIRDFGDPIKNFFTQSVPGFFSGIGSGLANDFKSWWNSFNGNFVTFVGRTFLNLIPGWLSGSDKNFAGSAKNWWGSFNSDVVGPIGHWFSQDIPASIAQFGSHWLKNAQDLWAWFNSNVVQPVGKFFTSDLVNWISQFGSHWLKNVQDMWNWFNSDLVHWLQTLFTSWIPTWISQFGSHWLNNVQSMWNWFNGDLVHWLQTFFTSWIPSWISQFGSHWLSNVRTMWSDLLNNVINPMGNWLSRTLPNAVQTGFRNAVNWVIQHVINAVINFIDNDILSHLPGSLHISTIGTVASGGDVGMAAGGPFARMSGSVPGVSALDGTRIMAMGGEYMLRQPARMALEQTFGRGFMNWLNQADSWLGAGSRGSVASQQRRPGVNYASGGLVNPIGSGLRPERVDMGVDYGGAGPLYALGSGTIRNLYNSGWPGGGFISIQLNPTYGSGYWYYAEDVAPLVHVNQGVTAGQHIANATGGPSGIEVGWAAPPGTGQTEAAALGQDKAGLSHGDPGAYPTAEGVAASNLIGSLGGPKGVVSGPIQGGTAGLGGAVAAIWQSVEGLLNAAGSGLGSLVAPLAKWVSGGAKELLSLARQGAASIFSFIWDHTVKPMVNLVPGDTIPGAISQGGAADIRQGVLNFLTGQDKQAQASAAAQNYASTNGSIAPVNGPADAGPAQAEAYAMSRLGAYGWGSGQFPNLQFLWNRESNWNRFARNPSSGAYGIPQALPPTKLPFAGQAAGGSHASPQIDWGLGYIKQVYGSPSGAWGHELAAGWYPFGGVIGEYPTGGAVGVPPTVGGNLQYPGASVPPGTGNNFADWQNYASMLTGSMWTEEAAFWALMNKALPPGPLPTMPQRYATTAWKNALEAQQLKTIGMGRNPPGAFMVLSEGLSDPSTLTKGQWTSFLTQLNTLLSWEEGTGVPGGANPYGTPPDSGWAAWKYLHPEWATELGDLRNLQNTAKSAYTAWYGSSGPGGPPGTPGPGGSGGTPGPGGSGGTPGPGGSGGGTSGPPTPGPGGGLGGIGGSVMVDLSKVATMGGPSNPVFGGTAPAMGFAAGGGLGDVAAMFSPGVVAPVFRPGGIPDVLLRRLSGAGGQSEMPRRLSEAGAAHSRIGLNVETLTIHNPVAEQPSQSIARASNRLAFLAGRGMG